MKILILGANGMAGSMLTSYLSIDHDVTALTRKNFDVIKDKLPDLSSFDYIINCIGLIKQKSDDKHLFHKLNSEFPLLLTAKYNKVIHISSDCIFSGNLEKDKSYHTSDVSDATDDYGKSKALGEPYNAMVLRTSIIGPSKDSYGLFEWFRQSKEYTVKGFTNHLWSGITTLELAKIINNIILTNSYKHGTYQIASNKVSKLELLNLIKNIFSIPKEILSYEDKISVNRSLIGDIVAKNLDEQLYELKDWLNDERYKNIFNTL